MRGSSIASVLLVLPLIAQAVPQFRVDPAALGSMGPAPFTASGVAGVASELLTVGPTSFSGSGILQLTAFTNSGFALLPSDTGLQTQYGLYLEFRLSGGGAVSSSSSSSLTRFDFQVFADPGIGNPATRTTFTPASVSGNTAIAPSVGGNSTDDVLLASGTLLQGILGFDALGGAYENSTQNFGLTPAGSLFFFNPAPFYSLAFLEFNSTQQGVSLTSDGHYIAVSNATGGIDFNGPSGPFDPAALPAASPVVVPEPEMLALLATGLAGLAVARQRRRVPARAGESARPRR